MGELKRDNRIHRASLQRTLGNHVRNELDKEKDTWREVQLIAMGKTYGEVAEIMMEENKAEGYRISGEMVRLDVEKALVDWKRANMANIDAYIAKDLYRIEQIEKIVLEDYEKTKHFLSPHEYAVLMKRGMSMEEIDAWFETHEKGGNPAYLDTLLHLQMQRMRLLGIDKGNDVVQNTQVNYNFGNLDDKALAKLATNCKILNLRS